MRVPLRAIAHSRSGDKGNTSNIAVIVYDQQLFACVAEQLTESRVKQHYAGVVTGDVTRYGVERLGAFNFVCEGALAGGVSRSLRLDNYGKTLASGILTITIDVPDTLSHLVVTPTT